MNREQKLAAIRRLQAKGHTKEQAKSMIAQLMSLTDKKNMTPDFAEGDKVMIDLESIKRDADYPRFTDKYKEWIHAHADDVFTVVFDERHRDLPVVVSLQEDTSDPKWLFWTGNLKAVESANA